MNSTKRNGLGRWEMGSGAHGLYIPVAVEPPPPGLDGLEWVGGTAQKKKHSTKEKGKGAKILLGNK